jgi:hypothetical protein
LSIITDEFNYKTAMANKLVEFMSFPVYHSLLLPFMKDILTSAYFHLFLVNFLSSGNNAGIADL